MKTAVVHGISCAVFRYNKTLVVTQKEKTLREDIVCGEEKEKKKKGKNMSF